MKTARFATVVQKYGEPEPYLVLSDPAKDRTLQAAIKSSRVMTVFQLAVGTAADRGVVGFEPGTGRQFLIFPKSLRDLAGAKIVGIKYDLWKTKEVPKSQRVTPPKGQHKKKKTRPARPVRAKPEAPANVVAFKNREDGENEESIEVAELKKQVRHAMDVLEQGKPVAAFNLLKRIVES